METGAQGVVSKDLRVLAGFFEQGVDLKLAQAFIDTATRDPASATTLRAIINFARDSETWQAEE